MNKRTRYLLRCRFVYDVRVEKGAFVIHHVGGECKRRLIFRRLTAALIYRRLMVFFLIRVSDYSGG